MNPPPSHTISGNLLAGGHSQNVISWNRPHSQPISTMISDFCLCDILAWVVEQWRILDHGQSRTCEFLGNEPLASLGGPNGPQMSPVARNTKNVSPEHFLHFPGTSSPLPEPWDPVDPCVSQPHGWTGDFLSPGRTPNMFPSSSQDPDGCLWWRILLQSLFDILMETPVQLWLYFSKCRHLSLRYSAEVFISWGLKRFRRWGRVSNKVRLGSCVPINPPFWWPNSHTQHKRWTLELVTINIVAEARWLGFV